MDKLEQFRQIIGDYYRQNGRDLPWRRPEPDGTFDPYKILISEMMLQQTQVSRVMPKYRAFLQKFPDIRSLAEAPLSEGLIAWSGLGYNRRAKYLHEAAKQLVSKARPWKLEDLVVCTGIGPNTAAAVLVYTYNQPLIFIETNIRTVYIHHFFKSITGTISDNDIVPLLHQTLDRQNPRQWFWALMDYGAHLKTSHGNLSRMSQHYSKQSTFEGSRRQIRGQVLRLLSQGTPLPLAKLEQSIPDKRLPMVLSDLRAEKLIAQQQLRYRLAS